MMTKNQGTKGVNYKVLTTPLQADVITPIMMLSNVEAAHTVAQNAAKNAANNTHNTPNNNAHKDVHNNTEPNNKPNNSTAKGDDSTTLPHASNNKAANGSSCNNLEDEERKKKHNNADELLCDNKNIEAKAGEDTTPPSFTTSQNLPLEGLFSGQDTIFFYESVITDSIKGRYSILAFGQNECYTFNDANGFGALQNIIDNLSVQSEGQNLPNFVGSLFFYATYDAAMGYHNIALSPKAVDTLQIAQINAVLPKFVVFFDKLFDTAFLCNIYSENISLAEAENQNQQIQQILYSPSALQNKAQPATNCTNNQKPHIFYNKKHEIEGFDGFYSNISAEEYKAGVQKCQQYIKAGDCFQVVPSLRLYKYVGEKYSSLNFYRRLRNINPSPFMFYIKTQDFCITGASPEIMVRLKNEQITIKPLAGTRKKTGDAKQDELIAKQLLADAKEISEHLILLDLGRNDVGSVAAYNSVSCPRQMEVEFYSHVMHISSTVCGQKKQTATEIDVLLAGMPAGTVSGGPKIRAMQIINEIEGVNRSFYSGCLGYIGKGVVESCIMLRTCLIKNASITLQAGAGVVYSSCPESEYQECINKMKAIIKAV